MRYQEIKMSALGGSAQKTRLTPYFGGKRTKYGGLIRTCYRPRTLHKLTQDINVAICYTLSKWNTAQKPHCPRFPSTLLLDRWRWICLLGLDSNTRDFPYTSVSKPDLLAVGEHDDGCRPFFPFSHPLTS